MHSILLTLNRKYQHLMNREEGQDLVEYALLVSLIALAVITSVTSVGTALATAFNTISSSI